MIDKLVIGTANFGLPYGIANGSMLPEAEVFEILDRAQGLGISWLDTARAYGCAEEVIGRFFRNRGKIFRVVTKLPGRDYLSREDVRTELHASLRALQADFIDLVLLHSYSTYERFGAVVVPALEEARSGGLIGGFGVSVYHPAEAERLLADDTGVTAVELPFNLFDRRFHRDDLCHRLKAAGIELFARSVFLQGLFFLNPDALPARLAGAASPLRLLQEISRQNGMSVAALALGFGARAPVDHVLIGVDSVEQLSANAAALVNGGTVWKASVAQRVEALEVADDNIILPYLWQR